MALDPTKPITGAAAAVARRARQLAAKNAVAQRVAAAEQAARAASGGGAIPFTQAAPSAPQVANVLNAGPAPLALNAAPEAIPLGPVGSTGPLGAIPASAAPIAQVAEAAPSAVAQSAAAAIPAEAAPIAETAAQTGIKGLMTRTPFLTGARALPAVDGATGMFAAGAKFGPGSLGRAGLYGLGGQVAGGIFDSIVGQRDGHIDDAASSALRWGGAGAGIGSMIMPGVGTVIGGIGGAMIGGIKGYMGGHDSAKTETYRYLHGKDGQSGVINQIADSMDQLGIDPTSKQDFGNQFQFLLGQVSTPKEAKAIVDQALQALPAIAEQSNALRQQQMQIDEDNKQVSARAAAIQTMMQQQLDRSTLSAQQGFDTMSAAAKNIKDPVLAATYQTHAANLLNSTQKTNMSYMQQLAMEPMFQPVAPPPRPAYVNTKSMPYGSSAWSAGQQSNKAAGYAP